jgi:hypothetical protein
VAFLHGCHTVANCQTKLTATGSKEQKILINSRGKTLQQNEALGGSSEPHLCVTRLPNTRGRTTLHIGVPDTPTQ